MEVVRRILAQWAKGNFDEEAIAALDPDVVFVVRPEFPEFGVFLGLDGLADFTRRFFAQWERYTLEEKDLRAVGDTVLARVVQRSAGKASGLEVNLESFMLFTFQGARIVRIDNMLGEEDALEAVGLRE